MADPHFQVIRPSAEDDLDQPVPASELQELDEEKRILSSVYRHVEHQQAVEQVAGVAGAISEVRALSESTNESKSPSSPWMTSLTQKTPSLPISVVGSEGSESISGGLHIRMSVDAGSIEAGDGRGDTVQELLSIPPSLDAALRLNMALQRRFRERIQKLEMVFMKNLDRQEKLRDEISNAKWVREQDQKTDGSGKVPLRISHFCVPYFKNRSGMPAPMNDDAKMKVKTGYIDLYVTRPRTWLTVERETLDETVRKEWREQNISSCETAIRELQRKLRNLDPEEGEGPVKQIEDEIKSLNESVKNLEGAPLHNIMPDRAEKLLDWDRIAARAFDGHRTSDECRLQWENLLHPVVNTEPFTENEDLIIQKLIMNSRSKVPDWDRIAFELRTSRATFQVMQRYVSFIEPTMKPKRWTKRDSDKLLHTINMLRVGTHIPWAQVHQHLVGFSRAQIQSRWRMIDPEISKGPFTVEEDFILIKGLHMFGLNFDSISHFMPGRTFPQVRDRYKRTILPGLSLKPWKKEEDAIIIKECSVGSRNWRKMIMQLPRFDACQIRSRYHIIQVWQTISGTNMVPPPLFPVTAAVKPDTIQEIRNAMIMEACNLKQLVDESRKGIRLKNVVKELEERRLIIKERKSHNNLQRMKKLTEKRGRQAGTPNPHYKPMQDIFLTEFFVPFRHSSVFPTLQFGNVVHSLKDLCKVLQLRILKQVTEDEATQLSLLRLTPSDLEIVKDLTATHERTIGRCCANNCPTCELAQPERIPVLPPCKTTLGTFRSILVHRPKLSEMATGEFFLHKYSRNELLRLESNCKGKRKRQSNFTLHETATGSGQSQPGNVSEGEVSQDESDAVLQVDAGDGPSAKFSQAKFHITTLVDVSDKQKKGPSKVKRSPLTDATQGVKAYSRGKIVKSEPVDVPCNVPNIKLEVNGQEVQSIEEIHNPASRPLSAENEKARKASESLLFHRMLSIFYWPAMMTLALPPQDLINQINEKIESGDLQKPPNTRADADKAKKSKSKDDLGIEEQVKYIEELNEKETEHQTQTGRCKGKRKYQKKGQLKKVSVETTTSDTNCQVDDDEETTLKEEEDRAGSDVEPNEEEAGEAAHKKVDGRANNKGLASHYRKRSLKSLRRSLVMKRIWDARRNGSYPQRTSDRDARNYNPRGSRTRNRVRKDMIKRPKSPRPWELPLDGPLRVQPQVPFIPSQEMLAIAFSESASTSTTLTEDHPVGNLKAPEDVPQHSSKVVRSKKLDPQEHREVPVQIRGSSTRTSTGSEGVKNETEARSKTSLDIKGKGQKRRKFVHSEAKVVNAPVEVHATMTDEPRENLLSKSAPPETNNSSKTVADTGTTKNKPKMSLLKSVTTQPRSQVTPPSESIDDVPESSVTETLVPDLEGVTEAKEVDTRPSLTPESVTQPLRKRPFEASFQNLLDDAVEIGESVGEKRTYFDPEEAINSSDIVVPQTREKRIKKPSYKKSYQVSFQSLLDDPVEAQNSSLPMEISPDLSSDLPVKIQPLVRGASRKRSSAKQQRKPPGSQVKLPSVTSGDESRVASPKGQIDGYTTALISSDKQLSCQTRVLLHQLPQDVVQPLLTDKPPLMDESRP